MKNQNRDKLTWAWFEYGTILERLRNARHFTPFDKEGIKQIKQERDKARDKIIKFEAEIEEPDETG